MDLFWRIILIGSAGAAGTLARYGTVLLLRTSTDRTGFPWGTTAVNLLGCLLIGLLNGLFLHRIEAREEVRLALVVGFLGGYTTFSSFGWETTELLRQGHLARAAAYILVNNVLGFALAFAGYMMVRR